MSDLMQDPAVWIAKAERQAEQQWALDHDAEPEGLPASTILLQVLVRRHYLERTDSMVYRMGANTGVRVDTYRCFDV